MKVSPVRAGSALPQVCNMDSLPKPQGRGFTEPWEWNKGGAGRRSAERDSAPPRVSLSALSVVVFFFLSGITAHHLWWGQW